MATAKIYRFKCYDVTIEWPHSHPQWGTLSAIDSLHRCVPLKETEHEVEESLLDEAGFLHGWPP